MKKVSSNRTVLISKRSIVQNEKQKLNEISNDNQNEEPKTKRIKVASVSPSSNSIGNEINQKDLSLKSIVTVPSTTDEHDYRHDINDKRKNSGNHNSNVSITENSKTKSSNSRSRSRSRSKSKDRHRRPVSTNPKNSSESNDKTKTSSRSSSSSTTTTTTTTTNDKQYRYRDKHQRERKRSSDLSNNNYYYQQYSDHLPDRYDLFNETSFRNSFPSGGHSQRDINDFNLSGNLHHQQQIEPIRHKRFNYNHQSVADHPRFAHQNTIPSPIPLMDFKFSNSSTHHHSISSVPMGDRK